eukprot:TRINITY_DN11387_c0_g1_i9.p1 TRINITY_DN11387_c0_g1~~TRINITY_DN11387_c0_g1_i9.p1  ORF type:complete len:247 (+),score=23.17 TRINITY_DN11387_c0_g1_i9:344-1084(+)
MFMNNGPFDSSLLYSHPTNRPSSRYFSCSEYQVLNDDILLELFSFYNRRLLLIVQLVCKQWYNIWTTLSKNEALFKSRCESKWGIAPYQHYSSYWEMYMQNNSRNKYSEKYVSKLYGELKQGRFSSLLIKLHPTLHQPSSPESFHEGKKLGIEKAFLKGATYQQVCGFLPHNQCLFFLCLLELPSGRKKIIRVHWAPDVARIREKMIFYSANCHLKKALPGVHVEIAGTDPSEIALEEVVEKVFSS